MQKSKEPILLVKEEDKGFWAIDIWARDISASDISAKDVLAKFTIKVVFLRWYSVISIKRSVLLNVGA